MLAVLLRIINHATVAPPIALSYLRYALRSIDGLGRISALETAKRIIEFANSESTRSLDSPFNAVLALVNEIASHNWLVGTVTTEAALEELFLVLELLKKSLPSTTTLTPTQIYIQQRLRVLAPVIDVKSLDGDERTNLSTLLDDLLSALLTSPLAKDINTILEGLLNQFQDSSTKRAPPRIKLDEEAFGSNPDLTLAHYLAKDLVRLDSHFLSEPG